MAYNINLANYINNQTNNTGINGVFGDNMSNQTINEAPGISKETAELIKNMFVGDVFTGEVLSIDENAVSIRANGKLLQANFLEQGSSLSKGDMLTFLVVDKSENKVSLKTLDTPAQEVLFAGKALNESNLAVNEANLSMVKELISQNMPIDKNTLNEMAKILNTFPDADLDTVTRLYKLNIPINEDNIKQFDAYKAYEHDMTGTISNLSEDFSKIIKSFVSEGSDGRAVVLAQDFLSLLSENSVKDNEGVLNDNVAEVIEDKIKPEDKALDRITTGEDELKNIIKNAIKDENASGADVLKDAVKFLKDETISDAGKNKLIQNILSDESIPPEAKSKIISSDEFKNFFEKQLKNNLFIKSEDVSEKAEVKDFYKRLLKTAAEGEKILEKAGLGNSDMAKGMHSVKSNVEFMNDLNHQMAFMQIPVKLQEGEARGDLYVFANRKARKGKSDELTALLHLDMKNLGPMDIYVKMSNGNNVSTNFCLESEEMLDFIYEHIDILSERLSEKGYNFKPVMTVKESDGEGKQGKNIDFEKDFLDVVEPVIPISRYLFDTKA